MEHQDEKLIKPQKKTEQIQIHLMVGFREICMVTAALPVVALFVCFVTSYIFQPNDIHETHCRVYNVIPSISAITGISPQRYLWRICIALHIGPRFAIAVVYRNYYRAQLTELTDQTLIKRGGCLIQLVYWLNLIEISSLCGVTYVSNRENYPIHEKVFIVFMICSLCHMLATIKLAELLKKPVTALQPGDEEEDIEKNASLKLKKILFGISIASTIGLLIFFTKHRFMCHEMAFSWFALCEYFIATANMMFHCTTMKDFPTEHFVVAKGASNLKGLKID